jgi:hypothetical protein
MRIGPRMGAIRATSTTLHPVRPLAKVMRIYRPILMMTTSLGRALARVAGIYRPILMMTTSLGRALARVAGIYRPILMMMIWQGYLLALARPMGMEGNRTLTSIRMMIQTSMGCPATPSLLMRQIARVLPYG